MAAKVRDIGLRGLGFRDEGLGFRDESLGFRDEGLGFGVFPHPLPSGIRVTASLENPPKSSQS